MPEYHIPVKYKIRVLHLCIAADDEDTARRAAASGTVYFLMLVRISTKFNCIQLEYGIQASFETFKK